MTITRVSAGASTVGVSTRTYSRRYFTRIADKCRGSTRWRQKLQVPWASCCATRRRCDEGTAKRARRQRAASIAAGDSHWRIRTRRTHSETEGPLKEYGGTPPANLFRGGTDWLPLDRCPRLHSDRCARSRAKTRAICRRWSRRFSAHDAMENFAATDLPRDFTAARSSPPSGERWNSRARLFSAFYGLAYFTRGRP